MNIICPLGTTWIESKESDNLRLTVNGQREGYCAKADGTRHGPAICFNSDGVKVSEGEYLDNLKSGEWKFWDRDGRPSGKGFFQSGRPDGEWTTWHSNGQIESLGSYKDGLQSGVFTYWGSDGAKLKELTFQSGELIETTWLPSENPTITP